jgi:tripartite-type tricarboxylate transporter receptor subunit TctC
MAMTPEAFTKYLNDDIVKWQRIVRVSGAKPDQ